VESCYINFSGKYLLQNRGVIYKHGMYILHDNIVYERVTRSLTRGDAVYKQHLIVIEESCNDVSHTMNICSRGRGRSEIPGTWLLLPLLTGHVRAYNCSYTAAQYLRRHDIVFIVLLYKLQSEFTYKGSVNLK